MVYTASYIPLVHQLHLAFITFYDLYTLQKTTLMLLPTMHYKVMMSSTLRTMNYIHTTAYALKNILHYVYIQNQAVWECLRNCQYIRLSKNAARKCWPDWWIVCPLSTITFHLDNGHLPHFLVLL